MKKSARVGKLYSFKRKVVFVASLNDDKCPRVSMANHGRNATFRDDYHGKLKMSKTIAKLIFKD